MIVSGLGQFALGQAVPNRDHAVCVSLPTVDDLIGYEEMHPKTLAAMSSGYPRFVQHRFLKELIAHEEQVHSSTGKRSFLFAKQKHCRDAVEHCAIKNPIIHERDEYIWLELEEGTSDADKIHSFLQHTGGSVSSRQAEDILTRKGLRVTRENISEHKNPDQFAREIMAEVHGQGVSPEGVIITSSGANAFYSLFRSARDSYVEKGKKIWIQLGWLYLDTIETMKMVGGEENIITLSNPGNEKELEKIFATHGNNIAGLVTEFPTNPLLQSCDLDRVRVLCDQADALLIVDPTMASPKNSKVAEFADVLVNSLTKYASWEGDVMIGSLVFPHDSKRGMELFEKTKEIVCPPFKRDLLRLCEQLPYYPNFVEKTNQSQLRVVEFLKSSNSVKNVYWAYQENSANFFRARAGDDKPGCVVSFEVNGDFKSFYNQLEMLKSPSFGTNFSLCCPYVYLAHYKMMQTPDGLAHLKRAGISPYLCRLSVGLEDVDQIIHTLQNALQGMKD